MKLDGAVALVSGGASGLGAATATRLAAEGARVVVADLDSAGAVRVSEAIGGVPVRVDVTDEGSAEHAVAEAVKLGRLGVVVNCAGIAPPTKLVGREGPKPLISFAKVIDVNLLGTINVLRCAVAAMLENEPDSQGERGVCVNTASIAAYEGQIGQVAYAASKAAVAGMTLPLARELAADGIRVVSIAPGLFDTPMMEGLPEAARRSLSGTVPFPQRLGGPAEYADLVEHIATNVMLNGEVIRIDGALRLAAR